MSTPEELLQRAMQCKVEAQALKRSFGATHYLPQADGVSMAMAYKQESVRYNDGTSSKRWVYLSYANIWMGSGVPVAELEASLVPIE